MDDHNFCFKKYLFKNVFSSSSEECVLYISELCCRELVSLSSVSVVSWFLGRVHALHICICSNKLRPTLFSYLGLVLAWNVLLDVESLRETLFLDLIKKCFKLFLLSYLTQACRTFTKTSLFSTDKNRVIPFLIYCFVLYDFR